jgi:hypothetical protein
MPRFSPPLPHLPHLPPSLAHQAPLQPGRRHWLGTQAALACTLLTVGQAARAATSERHPSPRTASPHVGVDPIFMASGLTGRWQAAMGRDLGWQAQWKPLDTADVLRQLESGEVDAGLFLSHPLADELDRQGLIHSRQSIATTDVLLVGPTDDLAGIRSERDVGRALNQVLLAAQAGAVNWAQPPEQSALAALMNQITQGKGVDPRALRAGTQLPAKGLAYELLPRVQWRPQDRRKVWLQGDARMVLAAQVACSFRVRHPGAKLLVNWLGWPLAQSAFKAAPGWRGIPGKPATPVAR